MILLLRSIQILHHPAHLASPSPTLLFPPIPSGPPAKTPLSTPETYSLEPTPPLRRFSRHITPPVKLNDYVRSYVCSDQLSSLIPGPSKGTRYPLANYVSCHRYKPAYRSFVAKLSVVIEPRSYSEAATHPD